MMSPAICSRVFVKLALILVTSSALPLLCQAPTRTEPDLYPNVWKDREPTDMEKLFHAVLTGDKSVVPRLAAAFDSATNSMEKRTIAGVLMRAGVKDEVYFTFLVSEARKSVDSDTPLPFVYGSDGKLIKGQWNPAFLAWCRKRQLDPHDTAMELVYERPAGLLELAATGDPRGYDLLVKALHSTNYELAIIGARGLAMIHDPRAIDEIITACQAAPSTEASSMAWALVYFNDPNAQRAAERFIIDKALLASLREDATPSRVQWQS
jgi:hypothetical protein